MGIGEGLVFLAGSLVLAVFVVSWIRDARSARRRLEAVSKRPPIYEWWLNNTPIRDAPLAPVDQWDASGSRTYQSTHTIPSVTAYGNYLIKDDWLTKHDYDYCPYCRCRYENERGSCSHCGAQRKDRHGR